MVNYKSTYGQPLGQPLVNHLSTTNQPEIYHKSTIIKKIGQPLVNH